MLNMIKGARRGPQPTPDHIPAPSSLAKQYAERINTAACTFRNLP
jgi:hypothetical protein